jgi:hypothetical protein
VMFSSSIHLLTHDKIFFFRAEYNSIVYKYHIILIHSLVVGHLGYLHSLSIVNSASINMVCECLYWNLTYILLGKYLGVVLLDHIAVLLFRFLRNLHTAFHSGYINLDSFQQCIWVPVFIFIVILLLKMATITGLRWNLSAVWFTFLL